MGYEHRKIWRENKETNEGVPGATSLSSHYEIDENMLTSVFEKLENHFQIRKNYYEKHELPGKMGVISNSSSRIRTTSQGSHKDPTVTVFRFRHIYYLLLLNI